jgi:predicted deacylase
VIKPERVVVEYTLTFTVPEGNVDRDPDEMLRPAVERAVQAMVLRLTDCYPYDYDFDMHDPYTVTVKVETIDNPDVKPPTDRLNEALEVVSRMLGQRCVREDDELVIDLHTDLEALKLLVAHGWADMHDRGGRITGYLH